MAYLSGESQKGCTASEQPIAERTAGALSCNPSVAGATQPPCFPGSPHAAIDNHGVLHSTFVRPKDAARKSIPPKKTIAQSLGKIK